MQKNGVNLGEGPVGRLLFRLAMPAILAQLINMLYNVVDRMYIGHIAEVGADALTGVGVTMPIIMVISAFSALVSTGGAPRASIFMGQGEHEKAEKVLGNCAAVLVVMAVLLTVFFSAYGREALLLFGASEQTIVYAWDYLQIYVLGTLFVQISMGLNMFINAQGFAKIGMCTVLIGAVCNIILDPILIFGFQMGVQGAALATILSQGISAAWVLKFLTGRKTVLRISKPNLRVESKIILPCIALGLSPFIMQLTESVLSVCFNTSLLEYGGDTAVGAMTILHSVMMFSMMPLQGLTQGAQPIISFNYGAKKLDRVFAAFRVLLISSLAMSGTIWLLCMTTPQLFIGMFTDNTVLAEYTRWALRIYMAVSVLLGVQIACQQTLIALGNAKISIVLALLRKVILLIPLIYILPNFFADKVMAVFLAEPVADVLAVSATVTAFTLTFRKLKKSQENEQVLS